MKVTNDFPLGWDESRVRDVLDHYEGQGDEDSFAEHEAIMAYPRQTLMGIPVELVPVFRQLIAEHEKERATR